MAKQWAAPMVRLLRNDDRPDDRSGQTARDQTGWRGRNLETADGEVPASGDGAGGEGRLQDRPTVRGSGSRDRERHTCHVRPLGGTLVGRGLGVSPH